MTPFEMRHRRRKGEDLISYLTRVIATECQSDIPGVHEDMIADALKFYRGRVEQHVEDIQRQRAESEQRHLQARLTDLTDRFKKVESEHAALVARMPRSVSWREAEEARQEAAANMRERIAVHFEDDGVPTSSSEAIREIPNPRQKWKI